MRLSQKTVYQMSQTMNMPGNFWSTHQPRTLDATVERSQSHAVFLVLAHIFYSCVNQNPHHFVLRHSTSSMSPSSSNSESSESSGSTTVKTVVFFNR
ncbi:hypothetical protein FD754_022177 [Muntiacus muntjak]|uniref:Uncharacterized protein n=1 Tax=Muntiacus muntjak TaxID=9888 RepID=A0A5N3VA96_MUNMU|nr:hypothetical protein FD754_022177 [Muntiacus muntjak]